MQGVQDMTLHPTFQKLLAPFAPRPKIVTRYIYPPIPDRSHDWCAWYDDDGEEAGRYGYGATEAEAIEDLTEEDVLEFLVRALEPWLER